MKLNVLDGSPEKLQNKRLVDNIKLPSPTKDFMGFYIKFNPSINRTEPDTLARKFIE